MCYRLYITGLLMATGMAIYPNGWKSPEIQQACGFTSHSYRLGEIFNVMCFLRSGCRCVVVIVVFDVVLFVGGGVFITCICFMYDLYVLLLLLLFLFVFCLFVVVCVLRPGRGGVDQDCTFSFYYYCVIYDHRLKSR